MSILQAIVAMTVAGGSSAPTATTGIRITELDASTYTSGSWQDLASSDYWTSGGSVTFNTDRFTFASGGSMYNNSNSNEVGITNPTAAVWIYFNSPPPGGDCTLIGGEMWALRADSSTDLNMVKYNVVDQHVTIPQLQAGQWYHIVSAMDTTETRYYINGVKVGTYTDSNPVLSSNSTLNIAGNSNLNADISKAQIYNFALSDIAVAGLYNSECAQFGLSPVSPPAIIETNFWGRYDPLTYSGSGNLTEGIGYASRDFVLSNTDSTITYSTRNRGKFICTGSSANDRLYIPDNFTGGQYTFMYASRLTGSVNQRIMQGINNNWLLGPWMGNTVSFYSEGWVYPENASPADGVSTNWMIHTGTVDTGGDIYAYYNNGSLIARDTWGSSGPDGLAIFASGNMYGGEHSAAEVGVILIWNKVLADYEVAQAYDYYRTRYGI